MSSSRLLPSLDDAGTSGGRVESAGSTRRPSSQDRLPSLNGTVSAGSSRDVLRPPSSSGAGMALNRTGTDSTAMSGGSMNAGQGKGSRSLKNVAGMLQRGLSFVEVVQDSSHIVELKKRVEVARKGGRLDLAGLALDHVPALALELGNMARVVWLQENLLKEFDPSVIAIWRSLAQLRLSSNLLTVLPPEIGRCRNLSMLFVDSNRLTALPSTISQCKVLTYLNVSNNRIKRLPVSIADIPQLHEFEYDNNPFEFPHKKVFVAGKVGIFKYLKRFITARKTGVLDLTKADLVEIPKEIGFVGDKLKHLKMNDIQPPSGFSFPFEIGMCSNLERADMHPQLKIVSPPEDTAKKGIKVIVQYLSRFAHAKDHGKLDLSHMNLSGFPPEISANGNLDVSIVRHLVLDDNNIASLPQALGLLPSITRLDASRNELKTLPAALARLHKLQELCVENNSILELSEAVGRIPILSTLHLRANKISVIAQTLITMPALTYLDLGENSLRQISTKVGNWTQLRTLILDNNDLAEIPRELCNLHHLTRLDMTNNVLRRLPGTIGSLTSLETLILRRTNLIELPGTMGELRRLTTLDLMECERLNALPYSLCDIATFQAPLVRGIPALTNLLIDDTFMQSPPPTVISEGIQGIYDFLNLNRVASETGFFEFVQRNLSEVPVSLYTQEMSAVTALNLASNHVSEISNIISTLGNLTSINFDHNLLETLPAGVSGLSSLARLSLKGNPLKRLPLELGGIPALKFLDLDPQIELEVPPKEISRKGGAAILSFFRKISDAEYSGSMPAQRLQLVSFPLEILYLADKGLTRLSISHNRLSSLPEELGALTGLQSLMAHDNQLSNLPKAIGECAGLTELDLEANRFRECPDGLSRLVSLTHLNFNRNVLEELPMHVSNMPLLAELFLDYNQIATIPNRIGRCARLNHLSLASNLLTRLPAAMKDLICITSLDVSNNRLKIVNPEVGLLPALECIDLSGNPLESPPLQVVRMGTAAVSAFLHRIQEMMETGRVDLQYCKLVDVPLDVLSYDAVHTIVLSHNDLDTLPQGIGNLRHLANLDVSFNHINNLPTEIGDCLGLQTLILSQNKLTKLPWSIGKLVNLTVLDLDLELILDPPLAVTRRGGKESVRYLKALLESRHQGVCEIHGFSMTEIPPEVMRITDILRLVLSSNGLVKLPASFVTLTRLETLKLDGNPLLKQLPRTLRSMTHIKELSVANNEYTMIPDEVFRLTNLEVLNASKNLLESVGNLIAQLANLTVLDLSGNKMWTLPWPSILKLTRLKELLLAGNPISSMSGSISAVTTLQRIDLSGSLLPLLPSDIIDLPRIEQIKLDDVDIQGPSTLVVADGLRAIFNFLGLIRKARSTTEVELTNFACDGGRRVGLAPYELHSVLLSLTIATSELEFVPTDVLELSNLTYLDLRFNVLKQFPEASLTAFPFLETLVLTDNELRSMPTGTGGMTALRSLILANNLLETLPASLGKCVNLTSLDLSNNQINYLPPEAKNLTNLTQLDMEFKTLTDLQTLALVWPQWGKPPADVILQGGKVIRQFYKDLLAASGQVAGIQGALGAQSSLTLRKYNLVRLPDQLHVKGFLTHLTSLDLSANKIANISDDISRLVKLRHLNLKGCPLKRLPAALGAIENLSISADFDKIENIPMLWLRLGEKGVLTYLRKVHIEASLGVMDLSNLQITSLPRNLLDLMQVSEMFLEGNHITALPKDIGNLTNITSLRLHANKLCCLPREMARLVKLNRLSLEGNNLSIIPTELGLLTTVNALSYDTRTFLPVPSEIAQIGQDAIFHFLAQVEMARGVQRMVTPLPGLQPGDSFEVNIDTQIYKVRVPAGHSVKSREPFPVYLPNLTPSYRARMNSEGFSFLKITSVGLYLDLSDLGLVKWRLAAVPAHFLDQAQDQILVARTRDTPGAKGNSPEKGGSPENSRGAWHDPRLDSDYQLDNDGVIQDKAPKEKKEGAGAKMMGFLKGAFGKEEKQVRDLPCMRYESDDLIATWMVDVSMCQAYPLPIGVTTSLTELRLDNNNLISLTSSFGTLSNLTLLSARNNRIESITWRMRFLIHLREAYLNNNRLLALPPKIGRCARLEILNVARNNLDRVPVSLGRLSALRSLDLSENPVTHLPHEIGGVDQDEYADVVGLLSIQRVSLMHCSFLQALPSKLFRLTTLEDLTLVGTSELRNPPPEVTMAGLEHVQLYLERLYKGEQTMNLDFSGLGLVDAPVTLSNVDKRLNEKQGVVMGMDKLLHLNLSHNLLERLNQNMRFLTNLRSLRVDYNRLQAIPKFIRHYTRLGLLSVANNWLEDFVEDIAELKSIRTVLASHNKLKHMSDAFGKLTTLVELSFEGNEITTIPDPILKLSDLKVLRLGSNKITRVPETIRQMQSLQRLLLNDNLIMAVPDSMGDMGALRELDLADNKIELLPVGLGRLTALARLEVRRNGCIRPPKGTQLKGPAAVVEYLRRVEGAMKRRLLRVDNLGLSSFPLDAIALNNITELDLSNNAVQTIPAEIAGLTALITLRIPRNGMKTLPPAVCMLGWLQLLDLRENLLNSLPTGLARLTKLHTLDLAHNLLEVFPPSLEALTQIQMLDLTDNKLSRMSYMIGRFLQADAILLGGNQLVVFPDSLGTMGDPVLSVINLSNNGLAKIPAALCSVVTLRRATFSGNALVELPAQMGRLKNLEELWVDYNQITLLPPTLGGWLSLRHLYVHNNKLKNLPKRIIELVNIQTLTLSSNLLTSLPIDMIAMTSLEEIWLDDNQLGTLPKGLEEMPHLKTFTCDGNPFFGNDIVRSQDLMEMFPDLDGKIRLRQLQSDQREEENRERAAEILATLEAEADFIEPMQKSQEEEVDEMIHEAVAKMQAATADQDFERAASIQEKVDRLQRKLAVLRGEASDNGEFAEEDAAAKAEAEAQERLDDAATRRMAHGEAMDLGSDDEHDDDG